LSEDNERACAVYRCYDAAGALQYIGSSFNPEERMKEHRMSRRWAQHTAKRTDQWFATEPEARAAEREAIGAEIPPGNLDGVPRLDRLEKLRVPHGPVIASPAYDLIAEYYREAIRSGALVMGDEMPSTSGLAKESGVARSTAQVALELLRDEGWIATRDRRPGVVAVGPSGPTRMGTTNAA
jgi:predicted GIY-YIG superfamily endonuclease